LGLGQTGWQNAGKQARLESPGGAPAELLRFEFKTKPVDASDVKLKAHDHSHEYEGKHRRLCLAKTRFTCIFNIPAKGFSTHSESSSLGGEEFGSAFVFEAINSLP
jgi:hypothetical protein